MKRQSPYLRRELLGIFDLLKTTNRYRRSFTQAFYGSIWIVCQNIEILSMSFLMYKMMSVVKHFHP